MRWQWNLMSHHQMLGDATSICEALCNVLRFENLKNHKNLQLGQCDELGTSIDKVWGVTRAWGKTRTWRTKEKLYQNPRNQYKNMKNQKNLLHTMQHITQLSQQLTSKLDQYLHLVDSIYGDMEHEAQCRHRQLQLHSLWIKSWTHI